MSEIDHAEPKLPRYCDVIMKGGTASAIVYPPLLATLAGRHAPFELRNLAGTSAGSIGAVLGAAAEYRRQQAKQQGKTDPAELSAGFDILDDFATLAAADGGILPRFEPTAAAAPLWEAIWAFRQAQGAWGRLHAVEKLVGAFGADLLAGLAGGMVVALLLAVTVLTRADWAALAVLAAALCALVWGPNSRPMRACAWLVLAASVAAALTGLSHLAAGWGLVSFVILGGLVGAVSGAAARVWTIFGRVLPTQGYGICEGARLTQWLHEQVQLVADLPVGRPLTFSDLAGCVPDSESPLQLAMLTTCLSQRRPYHLPFRQRCWWFDRDELAPLVGGVIVDALVQAATAPRTKAGPDPEEPDDDGPVLDCVTTSEGRRLYPLPCEGMPVVFAMRMSMALPVVLSAVPLWGRRFVNLAEDDSAEPEWAPVYERVWFSDGGTTSNLPIHLFDVMVPRWPTVTINLDYSSRPWDERGAWLADSNASGMAPPRFGIEGTLGFLTQLFETARNWQDSTQMVVPGQRDRIANVWLSAEEGGMNLDMSAESMGRVAAKARLAGQLLVERFHTPAGHAGLNWANHRWIRLLNATKLLEGALEQYQQAETTPPSYNDLLEGSRPPSYAKCVKAARESVEALRHQAPSAELSRCPHTPKPECELRIRPKL
ncbi:MAG: patatin-like phospholipase family protein [Armatimonadetes bacterium]|nr:patatin-like phospholipase family protein [Armatimonadota bacterium]